MDAFNTWLANSSLPLGLAAALTIFIAVSLFVFGFVPDDIDEEDIYGYRLTKRTRLLKENGLYALVLPLVKVFAHYFKSLPHTFLGIEVEAKREMLRKKLVRSGYMGALTPNEFWGLCCVSGLGIAAAIMVMTNLLQGMPNIPISIIVGLAGCSLPYLSLDSAITQRLVEVDRRLPYAVDLLVLSMRAGLDFMSALDRVVATGLEQNPEDPMVQELGVVLQEMKVGTARSDALINLCERVKSEYLKSMVSSILQSEKRGTPLATVLEVQIGTIRNKRTQRIEKAASQAAVKILGPLMFIFGAVLVIIIGAMVLKMRAQGGI